MKIKKCVKCGKYTLKDKCKCDKNSKVKEVSYKLLNFKSKVRKLRD